MLALCKYLVLLLLFFLNQGTSAQQTSGITKQTAEQAYLYGTTEEALTHYLHLAENDPNNWSYQYNSAFLHLLKGDTAKARVKFDLAQQLEIQNPWARYQLGEIILNEGDTAVAIELFKKNLVHDKSHLPSILVLAKTLNALGDSDEANYYIEKALKYRPYSFKTYLIGAKNYELNGELHNAIRLTNRGIEVFPYRELLEAGAGWAVEAGDEKAAEKYGQLLESLYIDSPSKGTRTTQAEESTFQDQTVTGISDLLSEQVGKRYIYKTKWGPFRLGTITIEYEDTTTVNGKECIPVSYKTVSNPYIPIINMDSIYRSYFDIVTGRLVFVETIVKDTWSNYTYFCILDHDEGILTQQFVDEQGRLDVIYSSLPADLVDGTSLLEKTRILVHNRVSSWIPTLINPDIVWTYIKFEDRKESLKVMREKTASFVVTGSANYSGIAGLTGSFKGWFTTDESSIPLKASFKIFIGSVKIELERIEKVD